MNNPIQNLAIRLIANNPQFIGNPRAQEFLQIIQNGDDVKGQQIANNLLKTYGVSRDDAIRQARQFFNV